MKNADVLKLSIIAFAGVVGFLAYKKVTQTGATVIDAAKKVITNDLNPLSPNNVIYKNTKDLPVVKQINNFTGSIIANLLDPKLMAQERAREAAAIEAKQQKEDYDHAASDNSYESITGLSRAKYDEMGNRIY